MHSEWYGPKKGSTKMLPDEVRTPITHRHTIADQVRRLAARHPDRLAVTDGETTLTYADLYDRAIGGAAVLSDLGAKEGDRVAFFGRNSIEYAVGWLSTQVLGAIHVPINFMLKADEVAYILNHASPTLAFADPDLSRTLRAAADKAGGNLAVGLIREDADSDENEPAFGSGLHAVSVSSADEWPGPASDRAVSQIAYTSGTESRPKGAMLSHRALMTQYVSCIVDGEYHRDDVVIHALPLYHCAQLHCFLMPYLYVGATNVIGSMDEGPAGLIHRIEEHQATSVFAPPTVWIGMLRDATFSPDKLATLRKGYYGASIMPTETIRELADLLPEMRLWNYYGQTEIAPLATVLRPEEQLERLGSAGKPTLHVETRVVDDDMNDVAPGEMGEVVHRSPQLLAGYYNDQQKTEDAFAGGWFHSGDLATVDEDGYISIVDRKKDMINSGGENVASREVEDVLYQDGAVAEVAVIGLPDPKWIERVCAVVVPRMDADTTDLERRLMDFASERLAAFKVPKEIRIADSLPKNPSGKILKRELRESLSSQEVDA